MTSALTNEKILAGRMPRMIVAAKKDSALPLEHTSVSAQISAGVASVLVTQRFGNPLGQAVDLEYIYPLPHDAAVTDFSLRIGARTVRGDIQEMGQARETFEQARASGRRAGLLEQRRPNLFGLSLANVLPGETIVAEVRYQQRLSFNADGYEFVFPMGLTPKYDSPGQPGEGEGTHAPVALPGETIGPVELNLSVDAGVACGEPSSPSHPLEVARLDERRFSLRLAGEQIPDHDFVLRYTVCGDLPAAAAWSSPAEGGGYFLASILPPRPESEPLPVRREFVFVLDRSGSMSGEPIVQARNALRACLRTLNSEDAFHILLFDDRMEWYKTQWTGVNQAEVDEADAFLAQVDARGGTEIVAALEGALDLKGDSERTRFVVFLTDGAVSAEARTLESLRRKLGTARVFTFGIGPSVNRALLAQMAGMGRGEAEFLQADEDIEGAIIRFQDRVSFPALTDISLSWKGARAWDVYPARLPDLYIGQPLLVSGRLQASWSASPVLKLSGKRGSETFEIEVAVQAGQPDPAIARVWARARVDELLDQAAIEPNKADKLRAAVIGLALEHRLVTPYTAFVAVDDQPALKPGKPNPLIRVAQPLPAGLEYDAFAGSPPSNAVFGLAMPAPAPMAAPRQPQRMMMMSSSEDELSDSNIDLSAPGGGLPAFLRKNARPKQIKDLPSIPEIEQETGALRAEPLPATRDEALRRLARTQQLDGSWGGDVERSAAALLAFARAGQTARQGSFRVAVRRAVEWLAANTGSGFACFARARALREMAAASGDAKLAALAQQAQSGLPAPANPLEAAFAADGRPSVSAAIQDLDGLRLAALAGGKAAAPAALLASELARAWAASLF